MTYSALVALCENRIDGLSRARLDLEQTVDPDRVARLVQDLRAAAAGWDAPVFRVPDGDPIELRVGARGVRDGAPGFAAVADVLDTYAAALEEGQAVHAAGTAYLRAAQRSAADLPDAGVVPPAAVEVVTGAAVAVLDVACAGYAARQDAYLAVRDAERELYAALQHVRVRPSGRRSDLRV